MKNILTYRVFESVRFSGLKNKDFKDVLKMMQEILQDERVINNDSLMFSLRKTPLIYFIDNWIRYFKTKYPELYDSEYCHKVTDRYDELSLAFGSLFFNIHRALQLKIHEDNGIILIKTEVLDHTITMKQLLQNWSPESPFKFKQEFLSHVESIYIDMINKMLLWRLRHVLFISLGIHSSGVALEVEQCVVILNKFWKEFSVFIPNFVEPIALKIMPESLSPQNLAFMKSHLPDYYELVKEGRSEEHRWKTDLSANMGDLGFD